MDTRRSRQRIEEQGVSTYGQGREERRITLMLLVVTITFFIFYAPVWILNFFHILHYKVKPGFDISANIFMMMNHANNPVIYGLMNQNFRKAGLELFCRKKARNTSAQALQVQTPV